MVTGCSDGPDDFASIEPWAQVTVDGIEPAASALPRATAPSSANLGVLGTGNRGFAFDLYQRVASSTAGKNVALSPYSISTALGMTYAGARGATASS